MARLAIFPVDVETLNYLRLTGRSEEQIALVNAYYKEQGLFHTTSSPEAKYSATLSLDLASVEPSVAGPRRPQDRVRLSDVAASFKTQLPMLKGSNPDTRNQRQVWRWDGEGGHPAESESNNAKGSPEPGRATSVKDRFGVEVDKYLDHGSIVIAAITSCTNTSNPSVMLAAGLLAKKAVERGLQIPPWVKSSLAPGSRVVTSYLDKAGLTPYLNTLRFHIVGYGCTTCIGNSGPLPPDVAKAIDDHGLVAVSVLSGNRNFEGRINSDVRAKHLMSPPLVVAYALAGRIDHDFEKDPLGKDQDGRSVYLRDIWPSQREIQSTLTDSIDPGMFRKEYSSVSEGDTNWQNLWFPTGRTYDWEASSTYIRKAPYFDGMQASPAAVEDIQKIRSCAGSTWRQCDDRPYISCRIDQA